MRFAQDCEPIYGTAVRAFAITELTPTDYAEQPLTDGPILRGGAADWNSNGMHHIDPHMLPGGSWLASVDGWRIRWCSDDLKKRYLSPMNQAPSKHSRLCCAASTGPGSIKKPTANGMRPSRFDAINSPLGSKETLPATKPGDRDAYL